ncbi:MAG: aminotransferase class III-fold pyridoxal phosphate-dependent enzyme, partial [Hyphomicrobium sp.]
MALSYWRNLDKTRTRIVVLEHAYHGDTIGTMSLGMRGVFNAPYAPLLFDVLRLPFPKLENEGEILQKIETFFKEQPPAALILEPLILGAGGMLIYSPLLLKKMHDIAKDHGTLVICDEVMTGFGRTGTFLASEQAKISPDILCLAKGLTGGSIPLAVTLATNEIFKAHLSSDRRKTFFHSSSYTANPIACAAATANLNIWLEEPVLDRISDLVKIQREHILKLKPKPYFKNLRQIGTITAMDLDVSDPGYLSEVGSKLYDHFIRTNVLLRPLGNTIYVLPPYCTKKQDLDLVYGSIDDLPEMKV